MDKGILLATKTLVESIRHYIRDPSGVFSVCHAREWYIEKFPPILLLFKMADEFRVWGVERRRHLSLLRTITKCYLLVSASCLPVVISHFLIETAKHAWTVWRDSAIGSTIDETWNGLCKQLLRLFLRSLRDNKASFIISCSNFNF